MNITNSLISFAEAQRLMPGGVSSPVRAFKAVGGTPRFIDRGDGPYIYDIDGNRYIDYVLSWGPLILGHAHPALVAALTDQISRGTSFGAPTQLEIRLAGSIREAMPCIEMIRFVNSGTEATMSAIRLARAFTGKNKMIKFAGCYHGHADMLLVEAGSGVMTLGMAASAGVTDGEVEDTITVQYNDLVGVRNAFESYAGQIAAVIVEPVAGNMGLVLPSEGFLDGLWELTREHEALLIFDEVMTGFRVALGGACAAYGIAADIVCLGKVIGGGLPVGAYGGRKDIMEQVAPLGPVYQAGTLSGNPLAMAAGVATLGELSEDTYTFLERQGARLLEGLRKIGKEYGIPLQTAQAGSMIGFFFSDVPVNDYTSARKYADTTRYARFFHAMLDRGVYLAPSQFEAGFLSIRHTDDVIDATLEAARGAMQEIAS
ncbi:MAG: glutamate-1-semialdehyde 2,1-aminomutase [Herpetosiphonaceae bacterium]|nr:MAG: glutamate-1-semialdehyde 2,1-aminomutase [Herpetosiphonaceae bacterium]